MERKTWLSGGETTMTQNILDIFCRKIGAVDFVVIVVLFHFLFTGNSLKLKLYAHRVKTLKSPQHTKEIISLTFYAVFLQWHGRKMESYSF